MNEKINLIGISGKIGSGKDLTGEIIQYLTSDFDKEMNLPFKTGEIYSLNSDFIIKKFARKLKLIVSILTGIPVKSLEDMDVKNSIIGPEWDYYLWGGYEGRTPVSGRPKLPTDIVREELRPDRIHQITYREMLQKVGTEAMRNQIHENVWLNALFADYKPESEYHIPANTPVGTEIDATMKYPSWVITDVRFPNEAKAIQDRGGKVIRINRSIPVQANVTSEHPSETALDDYDFDWIIYNDSTIDDLVINVRGMLNNFLII